jgi:hypothetical protein
MGGGPSAVVLAPRSGLSATRPTERCDRPITLWVDLCSEGPGRGSENQLARRSGPHEAVELVAGVVEAVGEVLPFVELFARARR